MLLSSMTLSMRDESRRARPGCPSRPRELQALQCARDRSARRGRGARMMGTSSFSGPTCSRPAWIACGRQRAACARYHPSVMPLSAAFSWSTTNAVLRLVVFHVPVDVDHAVGAVSKRSRICRAMLDLAVAAPGRRPRRPASAAPAGRAALRRP